MTFREAGVQDVAALHDLVHHAYRGDESRRGWTHEADLLDGQRTDPEALTDLLADPDAVVLLAETTAVGAEPPETILVGCCQLESRDGARAYFGMFAVRPVRQGRGLGSAMLTQAERLAASRWGATSLEMTVIGQREDLITWYERRGYRRTGATAPFPYGDERFGRPRRPDLAFVVLARDLPRP